MNCQEVMELMQRQLDDDLDESEITVLMNHTRQCPECAEMLERLKLLSAELTSLPKVTPSYSLVDAILPELLRIDEMKNTDTDTVTDTDTENALLPETDTVLPAAAAPDIGVQRRRKRWRSWGSIGGVVAAGIVASIFMITYPPNFGSNQNNSTGVAGDMTYSVALQNEAAGARSMTEDPGGDASTNDVGIQSFEAGLEGAANEQEGKQAPVTERLGEAAPAEGGDTSGTRSDSKPESVQQTGAVGEGTNADEGDQRFVAKYDGPVAKDMTDQSSTALNVEQMENSDMPESLTTGGMHNLISEEVALSPDGLYFAAVNNFTIVVTRADSGEELMKSSRKNGEFGGLVWSEDSSSLSYEVKLGQGAIEKYVISAKDWTEKKANH
ncbi:hypothetical protein A7K91_23815 [Paenibacillus oryzae]|uniref:Putative zinc-finger domain-containing protein n=1 Tax=Paenibacillus oryzae TaxID=1844972 RepID=A0A1A5YC01_9BACL|nr:zf-HC2 domain-containing protein [Paenibacillus oryzae]OBR63131.1 hypothetical protein A7K91_23815 [Paenibacillus oryzae]